MDDMACWPMTHIEICDYFIHCYAAIFLHDGFNCAMSSGVTTRCAWPGRGESVTELMLFMNFLVHPYTCCSDRHASPYWTFIRRWISMGFTPSLLKKRNRWQNAVLFWCMLQVGPPSLHYYCTVVLHFCIVLPTECHFSNHEYHCCQLKRKASCVSNFYLTLNFSFDSPSYKEAYRPIINVDIMVVSPKGAQKFCE